MSVIAALLLMAATVPPDDLAPYPADAVLAAFATACSGAESTEVALASAAAAGWERLAPDADTPVSRLAREGMAQAIARGKADDDEIVALPGAEFRKTVADRTLYLAVSGVRSGPFAIRGCRVYDPEAPRALTETELRDWAVRAPNSYDTRPDGVVHAKFEPGMKPGHTSMEAFYVPPGTTPVPGFDLAGLVLVANTLEF